MKHKAKPSGSSGGSRLRLTILLATAAAFLLVPAAQAFASGTMHVKITGTGSGEVNTSGSAYEFDEGSPPIECSYASPVPASGTCATGLELGLETEGIILGAFAGPGSVFAGWVFEEGHPNTETGFSCTSSPTAEERESEEAVFLFGPAERPGGYVCLGEDESAGEDVKVNVVFNKAFTVEKVGGEGTIVGANSGMECLPEQSSCTVEYTGPETLTASPAEGYAFSKWKGCTKVPTEVQSCTLTATSATKVIAYFVPTNSVKVTKSGLGYGTVKTTGISCDESCPTAEAAIQSGKPVKITATPAKGSEAAVISGGSGEASGCTASGCEFTINANQELTVAFAPIPTHTVKVNLTGPGAFKGKVTGAGAGVIKGLLKSKVNCGTGCTTQTESFFATDTVTLTATPATGYKFEGWSGDCSGTGTCVLATPSSNKVVNAEFK